jgi:hypothetical protein
LLARAVVDGARQALMARKAANERQLTGTANLDDRFEAASSTARSAVLDPQRPVGRSNCRWQRRRRQSPARPRFGIWAAAVQRDLPLEVELNSCLPARLGDTMDTELKN